MTHRYPKWIDEYARAMHRAFKNMVPCTWGPIDVFYVARNLDGTLISKIYTAISKLKEKKYSVGKIARSFSTLSTLRIELYWLALEYQNSKTKDKIFFREIIEFFIELLSYAAKKDIFAYESNIVHTDKETEKMLNKIKWEKSDILKAREVGRLFNSLSSLVFALYSDFLPQDGNDIYGPYDASKVFGPNTIFLIKHFPGIKPIKLWPATLEFKYKDVKFFQIYRGVQFKCEIFGMHSIYKGDLINGLVAYAILVDGKYQNDLQKIKKLSDYFAEAATKQSLILDHLSEKELKNKALYWLCYQFIDFFKLAKMDWRPTQEMFEAIKNKKFASRFELNKFPSYREYTTSPRYEIYWLKDLYK